MSSRPLGDIVFATSNPAKAREASHFLGRRVEARPLDVREIQSLSFETVVRAKALEASRVLGTAVLVDDSGLSLLAWHGYPGPFTRWAIDATGEDGFARLVDAVGDRRAEAVAALAVARPGDLENDVLVVVGRVSGRIAPAPRGTNGFGWDVIFIPEGEDRTYAEMDAGEKNADSHRARAFRALRALLPLG